MKIKNCRILKPLGINAIVLFPFVLYQDKHPSDLIIRHEQVHLDQIKDLGVINFYRRYLWEYIQGRRLGLNHDEAYRNISFEQEAYKIS